MRRSFAPIVAILVSLLTAAAPARADEPPPEPEPAPAPAPAAEPDAETREQARLHFQAGVNLLKDPDKPRYEEAYAEFKRAYELVKSPSILGNIGLCAMKLERDGEALEAYSRYLAEAPGLDPEERAQTERDIVTLRAQLAKITVESRPDGALIHDVRITSKGETITNIYGPIRGPTELGIRRGHHIIKARFSDGVEVAWELDANGGEAHVFERPAPVVAPPRQEAERPAAPTFITTRPVPPSVYIGAVTTGVLAVGTAVTGALALNAASRFDQANDGTNVGRAEDLRSTAQALNITSDVLLGLTVVGALVTTYLYLSRPSVSTPVTTPEHGSAGSKDTKRAARAPAPPNWVTAFSPFGARF